MITIIVFLVGTILTYIINFAVFYGKMNMWFLALIVLLAIAITILLNGLVATICCKCMPDKWYAGNKKIFNPSKKECRFYEKLGVKIWKDKILELGKANNFSKKSLSSTTNPAYAEKFIIENNKGFINHLISIIVIIFAIFILPKKFWLPMGLPIAITNFIINYMSLIILRYNMPRLQVLLKYSKRAKERLNSNK